MSTPTAITRLALASALASTLALLAACGDTDAGDEAMPLDTASAADTGTAAEAAGPRTATARLSPTEGNEVQGTVTFAETGTGVRVSADLTGLSEGEHGFHVHETGDCGAPDGSSAGGHFAPEGSRHGGPDQQPPEAHVGDMGNLTADADGAGRYEGSFDDMTFDGPRGIVGKAVIVHAGADDLTSQPSGDAGDRVACGVIEIGDTGEADAGM